jgi:hypothetical protein
MPVNSVASSPAALLHRFMAWWCIEELKPRWVKPILLAIAGCYFAFLAVKQTGPLVRYAHDVFILLDGAWRIYNGQVPYRDFYLALGPLEYSVTAAAMFLTGGAPSAIALGNVAFGIAFGVWGWFLSRRRMSMLPSLVAAGWLVLTATSPTPIGVPATDLSCAMSYNRHGYALLGILLIECAFLDRRSKFAGGVSSGVLLALLAFLKLNFFGCGCVLILASIAFVRRDSFSRIWGIVLGFVCASLPFLIFLRFSLAPYFADLRTATHARIHVLNGVDAFNQIMGSGDVVILTIATIVTISLASERSLRWATMVSFLALWSLVVVSCAMLSQSDAAEGKVFVLLPLWAILLLGKLSAVYPDSQEKSSVSLVALMCIGSLFVCFFQDAASILTLVRYSLPPLRASGFHLAHPGMGRLRFFETGAQEKNEADRLSTAQYLSASVNQGVALLDKYAQPSETILTLGFTNPFPYIERRRPAIGGSPWLSVTNNLPTTNLPDPLRIFGNADLIMLPTCHKGDPPLHAAYKPYLLEHFSYVASATCWSLYRRAER